MEKNILFWFLSWIQNHFENEENNGIYLTTIDNPGWNLEIRIDGTQLENRSFVKVCKEQSENDWVYTAPH